MDETSDKSGVVRDAFGVQKSLLLNDHPLIFDVGAFVGQVTDHYRKLFPFALIHSFEPFPPAFRHLQQNTSRDPMIRAHNMAISDKCETVAFNSNAFAPTNSLLKTDKDGKAYWGDGVLNTRDEITVSATTIDHFCEEQGVAMIDILKLDIQGAEYKAFAGAEEMLSKQSISIIYTEIILVPTYVGQRKFHEYLQFLDSHGYILFGIYNPVYMALQLNQIDALFVSKEYLNSVGLQAP